MKTEKEYNDLTGNIIHAATEVHRQLGPGLLESVYEICLEKELLLRNMKVERQKRLPVIYKGDILDKDFIIDLLVEDEIVIELKAVDELIPVHEVQLLTYMKLSNRPLGLLINFNTPLLKSGIRRKINTYFTK